MKKTLHFFITLVFILSIPLLSAFSQVGINTDGSGPNSSAGLDVKFINKGFLPPRMTQTQLYSIVSPADGLVVYCTNCGLNSLGALSMFMSGEWYTLSTNCLNPLSPVTGTHVATPTQIVWNWNTVTGATGYKWSATNNYSTATDLGTNTSKTETGLNCLTLYSRYIWSYNACGNSTAQTLNQSTSACLFTCGSSITINHIAGTTAPVTKTVAYGTVTNIPGETSKCWITSNLGSDHQATAVNDATEASAGWYWQFNRKQGYKHTGTTVTPNTAWVSVISENSAWTPANDPCTIELGNSWRIPTSTEWTNVDAGGAWTDWNYPWNSGLKMHAAGYVEMYTLTLYFRGEECDSWSSTQFASTTGQFLIFGMGFSYMGVTTKVDGLSLRCIRE